MYVHWKPVTGTPSTVQLGMESDQGAYTALSFGGTSGMSGNAYMLVGYHDGTSGAVSAHKSTSTSAPSPTTELTVSPRRRPRGPPAARPPAPEDPSHGLPARELPEREIIGPRCA